MAELWQQMVCEGEAAAVGLSSTSLRRGLVGNSQLQGGEHQPLL